MDLWSLLEAARRLWWVVGGLAILCMAVGWLVLPQAPYQVTIQASVMVPGNIERPGRAERPELMVLDDLLPLVESPAFATLVRESLAPLWDQRVSVADIENALSGSRYSRILSVTVATSSPERSRAIGDAVNTALPQAVLRFLVAPGDAEPAVRIIDPGGTPEQLLLRRWLAIGVIGMFAAFAAVSVIWFREATAVSRARNPGGHPASRASLPAKKSAR